MNKCIIPTCPQFDKYCRLHKGFEPIKDDKPIAKESDKMKVAKAEYRKKIKVFLQKNPLCTLKFKGCTGKAEGGHHRKGKSSIELLLDFTFIEPACNFCNTTAEIKDAEARQKDIKLSKFNDKLTNA